MTAPDPSSPRARVWLAMAEHFLDTETRHSIPLTALACLEAGLGVREAREVWRYEVSRAVAFNTWSVAGEWSGWDAEWLVHRIERLRRRWDNLPWTGRAIRYHLRRRIMEGVWRSIALHMEALMGFEEGAAREQAARDMSDLARHFFDFAPDELSADQRARLEALFRGPFERAIAPALVSRAEAASGRERALAALSGEGS